MYQPSDLRLRIAEATKIQRVEDGAWVTTKRAIETQAVAQSRYGIFRIKLNGKVYAVDNSHVEVLD